MDFFIGFSSLYIEGSGSGFLHGKKPLMEIL